jgi:hypothetical protein
MMTREQLEEMTVKELSALAEQREVPLVGRERKAELVDALLAHTVLPKVPDLDATLSYSDARDAIELARSAPPDTAEYAVEVRAMEPAPVRVPNGRLIEQHYSGQETYRGADLHTETWMRKDGEFTFVCTSREVDQPKYKGDKE